MSELLLAVRPFKGTAPQVVSVGPGELVALTIFNDSNAEMTFKAGDNFTFTVAAGDAFDERLEPFSKLEITAANGQYRGYCRKLVR